MRHRLFAIALAPLLILGATSVTPASDADDVASKAEAVKKDPNSAELLNEYMAEAIGSILATLESDSAAAQKALDELKGVLDALNPQAEEARQLLERARQVVPIIAQRIELAKVSLEDLQAKLRADVDDPLALTQYREKLFMELGSKAYSAPAEAKEQLAAARAFLAGVSSRAADKQEYIQTLQILDQLGGQIESNLAREAIIGKDAAPLAVEAWVNGDPLTDSDLKGKVVLLDFWAVWCGPCIATFPHLIEWHEQYGDKGLVIIGLTSYYEFGWDDAAGRALPKPGTTPEQEREMLVKFAAQHGLKHRFAIQDGDAMSEFYGVQGIPQVVVIDQQGKIRMVRVGSGDQNARDIGNLLAELLGAPEKADE